MDIDNGTIESILRDEKFTSSNTSSGGYNTNAKKEEKYIVEAGSCTTVVAVMEHQDRIGGKNIALVLSGGNIDGKRLISILGKY